MIVDKEERIVPIPKATPAPTIVTPSQTPENSKPFKNVWDFVKYVQNNWKYVYKQKGEVVQNPQDSYRTLRGNCEDFSTMVAYYLKEVYGYDTFIVSIDIEGNLCSGPDAAYGDCGLHDVAYVSVDQSIIQDITNNCGQSPPIITNNDGRTYVPIDWKICERWQWTSNGKITEYQWNDIVGLIQG